MTTVDDALTSSDEDRPVAPPAENWIGAIDQFLGRAGEYLNPILVKETRQAIKSRQFLVTFTLLLLSVWVWSIYGIAWLGLTPSYSTGGPVLFYGYFVILSFPLLVVVPFSAFRSLASEREDRTYELLSITALRPRQIVGGKLGSAVVQMTVFLSAVAPCLAFTYILRGIDILTILMMIGYIFFASIGFSLIGLLIATLAVERYVQTFLSVVLIAGQLIAWVSTLFISFALLQIVWSFQDADFWTANAVGATAYVGYFALFYFAAAGQLSSASENRSTPLRVVMLLHFAALVGWISAALTLGTTSPNSFGDVGIVFVTMAGIHWATMGMFLVGESPKISPRVRRALPKTFLGRALFTWLCPGPATGYVLAVSGMLATVLFAVGGLLLVGTIGGQIDPFALVQLGAGQSRYAQVTFRLAIYAIAFASYVTIFLGLGKILIAYLRRWSPEGVILPLVCNVLLVLVGTGLPFFILMSIEDRPRYDQYTLWQVTNPFMTLGELAGNSRRGFAYTGDVMLILVPSAIIVFLLNLPSIFNEIVLVRVEKPQRVLEDDRQGEKHPPPSQTRQRPVIFPQLEKKTPNEPSG